MSRAAKWSVGLVLLALPAAASETPVDDRSRVLLLRDCSSKPGRNELTLFANGTIRLRQWSADAETLQLVELGREEVEAVVRRLAAIDFRETPQRPATGMSGEWVERCDLELALRGTAPRKFRFGKLDTHDLAVASLLRIGDELAALASAHAVSTALPAGYVPKRGDLLARSDGVEFEVVGFTADGNGVELRGRLDPLTVYMPKSEIQRQFARLVRRGP